jgi:hypothetical protein
MNPDPDRSKHAERVIHQFRRRLSARFSGVQPGVEAGFSPPPPGQELPTDSLDPLSRDLDPMALDRKIAELERIRATRMLLVSKPVADGFTPFGWKPSPLFRRPNGAEDRINPSIDPARLKRLLGEAFQQGAIDPGEIKEMLSQAVQEGGIDLRALKKMLAQAHWKVGGDASLFEQKGLPPGMKLPFDHDLDQQKREMEKQPGGRRRSGKPFVGIAPDF